MLHKLTGDELAGLEQDAAAVVLMWQPTCGPCTTAKHVITTLSKEYPDVKCYMCNSRESRGVKAHFGTKGTPTFLFLQHGKEMVALRITGVKPMATFHNAIKAITEDESGHE